jgi:hypothetical protein
MRDTDACDVSAEPMQPATYAAVKKMFRKFPPAASMTSTEPMSGSSKAFEGNTREFHCFRPGEVIAECARHGFGRPAARRQLFMPMVVHRAVGRAVLSRGIERASGLLGLTRALGSPVVLRVQRRAEREDEG